MHHKRSAEEIANLETWRHFEAEVFAEIRRTLRTGNLLLAPESAKVFLKKGYFSRDRGKDIVFDVAVEGYAGKSPEPSLIWLWECKDYPLRKVKVDEVEEFYAKMQQVGCGKGTVVTRLGFEGGAIAFAKSKGIGLATCRKILEAYTNFSAEDASFESVVIRAHEGIRTVGQSFSPAACLALRQMISMEMKDAGFRCRY
jgi:hypothetical protein